MTRKGQFATHLTSKVYKERKRKAGYEENVPRCASCVYRGTIKPALQEIHWCTKGLFRIKMDACCDRWEGRDGTKLETN